MASPMWCCNSCSPWRPSEAPFVAKSYPPPSPCAFKGPPMWRSFKPKKSRTFINSRKQPKSPPEDLSEPKLSWDVFFVVLLHWKDPTGRFGWIKTRRADIVASQTSLVVNKSCQLAVFLFIDDNKMGIWHSFGCAGRHMIFLLTHVLYGSWTRTFSWFETISVQFH